MTRFGQHTICPNCGAQDSLQQEVELQSSGTRPVRLAGPDGARKVEYGTAETDSGLEEIVAEQCIECTRCKQIWEDEKDLLDVGPPVEHRCTGCDWWGFNDFQHGLERSACAGSVYRIDKPPVEVAA